MDWSVLTPMSAAGGQFNQRGAECRRSTGSSFQRSDYSSGRGGGGRRGQVRVIHLSHLSSVSICRFLSLFLSTALSLPRHLLLSCGFVTAPTPSCHLAPTLLSSDCGFLILTTACLCTVLSWFFLKKESQYKATSVRASSWRGLWCLACSVYFNVPVIISAVHYLITNINVMLMRSFLSLPVRGKHNAG